MTLQWRCLVLKRIGQAVQQRQPPDAKQGRSEEEMYLHTRRASYKFSLNKKLYFQHNSGLVLSSANIVLPKHCSILLELSIFGESGL